MSHKNTHDRQYEVWHMSSACGFPVHSCGESRRKRRQLNRDWSRSGRKHNIEAYLRYLGIQGTLAD